MGRLGVVGLKFGVRADLTDEHQTHREGGVVVDREAVIAGQCHYLVSFVCRGDRGCDQPDNTKLRSRPEVDGG